MLPRLRVTNGVDWWRVIPLRANRVRAAGRAALASCGAASGLLSEEGVTMEVLEGAALQADNQVLWLQKGIIAMML